MKIVYFIDHLRPDGSQRALTQLVEGLSSRGCVQAVVCLNDSWDEEVVGRLWAAGCEVRIVGKASLASGAGLVSTYRWLKQERFEVAVTMLFYADVFGSPLARYVGVPRVVTALRARNVNYNPLQRRLERRMVTSADMVVVNSHALRDYALMEAGARPGKLAVIPNGVQVSSYCQPYDRSSISKKFGFPESKRIIGSAGRMTHQKGIDLLLEAASQISENNVQLLLVGEGEEIPNLRRLALAKGLNGSVHFSGYRRDLPRLLGALDIYVQPSRFEGMPNTLLEAMAAGCPVVASAVDGNLELVTDGETGWLSPPNDSRALAGCISAALSDPEEARHRGEAGRQRVAKSYNLDQMIDRWEKVLHGK